MSDLQWALTILGILFLAGLGLWELRRSRRRDDRTPAAPPTPPTLSDIALETEPRASRREPRIAEFGTQADTAAQPPRLEMDADEDPAQTLHVSLSDEEAVDIPAAVSEAPGSAPESGAEGEAGPAPIRWPPQQLPERVLGLRVVAGSELFGGKPVRLALLAAGLRHGPQQIFHRTDTDGNVLASVANLVRPGSLLPEQMDGQSFRGLSLFAVLPGPRPAQQILDDLVVLARQLAVRLGGVVQDEHGAELDTRRLAQLRQAVSDDAPGVSGEDGLGV
jgi:cell division protein ZipA